MNHLLWACSAHLFGRSAYKRLLLLFSLVILAGSFIGIMIGKSVDAPPQSINRLSFSFLFAAQITVLALCLPLSLNRLRDTLPRLGRVIPFSLRQQVIIRAFPNLIALSLCFCGLAWPAASIGSALGLAPFVTIGSLVLGSISGWSLLYAVLWLPRYTALPLGIILIATEFLLVRSINQTFSATPFIIAFCILIDLEITGIRFFTKQQPHASWYISTEKVLISFSSRLWWVAKIWRHRRTKIGLITVSVASLAIAVFAWHAQAVQPGFIAPVVALLAASFACDLRPIAHLNRPFDIAGVRGYLHFVKAVGLSGLTVCLVGLLPLWGAFALTTPPLQDILSLCSALLLGYSIGLWVGFLLVPQSRDPLGQTLSVGLASVLLFCFSKLPIVSNASAIGKIILYTSLALLAVVHCGIIEYKRNTFLWRRKNHV